MGSLALGRKSSLGAGESSVAIRFVANSFDLRARPSMESGGSARRGTTEAAAGKEAAAASAYAAGETLPRRWPITSGGSDSAVPARNVLKVGYRYVDVGTDIAFSFPDWH